MRRKGSKVHAAVDTLGHLLALHVTAADEQDRAHVEKLADRVQEITGKNVELAYVDQGYTGESAAQAAERHGVQLEVVRQLKLDGKRWQLCGPLSGEPVQVIRIAQRALVFYRRTLLRELDLTTGANHAVECR